MLTRILVGEGDDLNRAESFYFNPKCDISLFPVGLATLNVVFS